MTPAQEPEEDDGAENADYFIFCHLHGGYFPVENIKEREGLPIGYEIRSACGHRFNLKYGFSYTIVGNTRCIEVFSEMEH